MLKMGFGDKLHFHCKMFCIDERESLVMEALNKMMGRAVSGDFLKGFDASCRGHQQCDDYISFIHK